MKRALAIALLALSAPASATLFCYDTAVGGLEWNAGQFVYTDLQGHVRSNPGPQLLPSFGEVIYCWADGPELTYVDKNLGLRFRVASKSLQPGGSVIVYWTGDDARYLWNNL